MSAKVGCGVETGAHWRVGRAMQIVRGRRRWRAAALTGISLFVAASGAHGAGFALREYSLSAEGSAFAGASALSDEPGGLSYNAATGSGVGDWDMSVTAGFIDPDTTGTFSTALTSFGTPTGGDREVREIQDAVEPGMQLRYRLSEQWTAGLSVTAPFGLGTKYREDWAGRYYAIESKLITVNAAPSLAWQVTPQFTIAAGAQLQYATGKLSNAIDFGTIGAANGVPGAVPGTQDGKVEYTPDGWAVGYTVGALWQPQPDLRIGASYRSELHHDLKGDVDFTLDSAGVGAALSAFTGAFVDGQGRSSITLPAVAALGIAYDLTPELSLLAEYDYTWWSSFDELRVKFANPLQPDSFQTYDYKNTYFASVGLRYRPSPDWVLRTGVGFDQSPTRDATRDPRIPDNDRKWVALSVGYKLTDHIEIEAGYSRLMFPDGPINLFASTPGNEVRGDLAGVTRANSDVFTLQFTFR
jgi:long-chain fatty acid transport protein